MPNHDKPSPLSEESADDSTHAPWCVYIILSSDNRLYTGITTDIEKRWHAHCHSPQGAKFFRGRKPQQLLHLETGFDRSTASQREAAIKQLRRPQKLALVAEQSHINWHAQLHLPSPHLLAPSPTKCESETRGGRVPPPPKPQRQQTPVGE